MNNFNRSLICIVWFLLLVSGSALQARASTVFFHNDALGSPLAATDEAGKVLWKENYEPFGDRQVKAVSANNNKLWFAGKPHDESSGLSYFNARYYSPLLGRFISVDPVDPVVGDVHHFNRYAYAHNNPNKYIDPDGKLPFLIPVAIFLAKELAVEGLSYATNGATDYLSVRRLGTMVAGHIAEKSLAVAVRNGIKDLPGNVAKGGGKADFIVSRDGAVVPNSPAAARKSLESAGFKGENSPNPSGTETGTIHNIPGMKMDVRVMNGGPNHPPRIVTTRQGNPRQPVNPSNGSNFGNVPRAEQRARSHIPFQ